MRVTRTLLIACLFCVAMAVPSRGMHRVERQEEADAVDRTAAEARKAVRVGVIDWVGSDVPTVSASIREAARIFEKSGIPLQWVYVRADPADEAATRDVRYIVRLLPNRVTPTARATGEMGRTIGLLADVHYETLQSYMRQCLQRGEVVGVPFSVLLGHVIAHELGHVLLGPGHHTGQGIMRANWSAERGIPEMRTGRLLFSKDQAARIRERFANECSDLTGPVHNRPGALQSQEAHEGV